MALQQWALPRLAELLPLSEGELRQIISYNDTLPNSEAAKNLSGLLGESPQALRFIAAFTEYRTELQAGVAKPAGDSKSNDFSQQSYSPLSGTQPAVSNNDSKHTPGIDPGNGSSAHSKDGKESGSMTDLPPSYAPRANLPFNGATRATGLNHTNKVIQAAKLRAKDEQEMQQRLQNLQFQYRIYNSEIEPEHDTDYPCSCPIHVYQAHKRNRYGVQEMWSKAVMYPGEKSYNDNKYATGLFSKNPYTMRIVSPYGFNQVSFGYNQFMSMGQPRPRPAYHAQSIHQTIALNNSLNRESQVNIDTKEPKHSVWADDVLDTAMSNMSIGNTSNRGEAGIDKKGQDEKPSAEKRQSIFSLKTDTTGAPKTSKLTSFRKSMGIKSSEEKALAKVVKAVGKGEALRNEIIAEEQGRWPDMEWRNLVAIYQGKVGMTGKISHLRARCPIQYLHLLRAGYFEPIPVAWANQASNPLKFSIEAAAGWRGITPAWRGYEDTAEERLYWVLNHREGSVGMRMKPDFISEMNMARARMASAVEPPPLYFSANDTCHIQHTSSGYSKQVMPPPFRAYDRPEVPTDDTMVLLDVSGSMDFDPVRPVYDQYLITRYEGSNQPKNKDLAKAIIRRFIDAMENHDREFSGYDLLTFSHKADYIGTINHQNLDSMWRNVRLGGGTRVMTGWQMVKDRHFQKHSESATHHPVYGWQAGPDTPMLRLLLMLDGEATDMDEFELDLLGLSWAHVTIFLIGVDGCPHHHRHANELQRISDVNHHVSFVDAQGNTPERFVTHELLKRHLGYEVTMQEFEQMEELPAYTE